MIFFQGTKSNAKKVSLCFQLLIIFFCLVSSQSASGKSCSQAVVDSDSAFHSMPMKGKNSPDTLSETQLKFTFQFTDNTVFSTEDFTPITSPYEKAEITFEELQELRRTITEVYVNNGYITSGAIIHVPKEAVYHKSIIADPNNRVIIIKIMEGTLQKENLAIHGNKYFREGYLINRLMLAAGPPVNGNNLNSGIRRLNQDLRIKYINAELKPGTQLGQSILNVKMEEERPFKLDLAVDNNISSNLGEIHAQVKGAHQNLTGNGDFFDVNLGFAEGLDDIGVSYSIPISRRDTSLAIQFRKCNSTVIDDIFKKLDIKSEYTIYTFTLSHPYQQFIDRNHQLIDQKFSLALTGEHCQTKSSVLGEPFSFSSGAEDGELNVTVFRFSFDWIRRGQIQAIAARTIVNTGVDAFDATINTSEGDSQFLSWQGQFQWIKCFTRIKSQILLRSDIQITEDSLPPSEKFTAGGLDPVRGYPKNYSVKDNGYILSFELRKSLNRKNTITLVPFIDYAQLWEKHNQEHHRDSISGAGIGFRGKIMRHMDLQAFAGFPLRKIDTSYKEHNDVRGHFTASYSFF